MTILEYLDPWDTKSLMHIQSPLKDLRWSDGMLKAIIMFPMHSTLAGC